MMSSTISIFTRPSSGCSPASNPTTPIRMITTPTTPAYVLAMFFRPPCKNRSSTQVRAATAEKLADSLTFLPYLLSDGPLRHLEADLRVDAVAERLRRRSPATTQRYRLVLRAELVASASTITGSFTRYGPSRVTIFGCSAIVSHVSMTDGLLVHRAHERTQVDVGILKLCAVDRTLGFDQPHRAAQVPSPVDSHGREDPLVLSVECHEVSLLHAASHNELIPLLVEPGVLEVEVILIRPEPGDIIIGFVLTQHVPGRGRTLIQRVLPVLHADPPLEHRVVVVGHVTRRVDPLHARPAKFIDHDAVVDVRAGVCEQLRDRLDAEAHHDKVALNSAPALGHDPLHTIGAFQGGHRVLEDQLRSVVAVDPFHHPADLFTEDPTQRHLVAIHNNDLHARLPK